LLEIPQMTLMDRIVILDQNGYLTPEVRDALHTIRKKGNEAAHDARMFRLSEALLSWEALYSVTRWFIEVYGPVQLKVPDYKDPVPNLEQQIEIAELAIRIKEIIERLNHPEETEKEGKDRSHKELPGFTTVWTITYKDHSLDIPYFLRDAFLLPQRFPKSETFLIRLGAVQQARIMSELPNDLEGLHRYVKRYNDTNDKNFFDELKIYVEEEKARRKLIVQRPGELFLFFKADHIIVTEDLASVPITNEEFTGFPKFIEQLNQDEIYTVGQLPQELVILAKYESVGIGTVEKLFNQLKEKANAKQLV